MIEPAEPPGFGESAPAVLSIEGIGKRFGALRVLERVDAAIQRGRITAFIGPNGAGKTTLFNTVSGDIAPDTGRVRLEGRDVTRMAPWKIARLGLGRQFQDVRVFRALSCEQNVLLALRLHSRRSPSSFLADLGSRAARYARLQAQAQMLLAEVGLAASHAAPAGTLSFGNQKLLAFARLLAGGFRVLLLDEPSSGVSSIVLERITRLIERAVADDGATVAMIEHNMNFVAGLAHTTYVLKDGTIFDHGPTAEVLARPANRELCLGM